MKDIKGTRSIYAERVTGGYFVDFDIKREEIARFGLSIKEVEAIIMSAIGGEPVTTTVEGRERYTVNVRYPRDLRSNPRSIANDVLIALPNGGTVPLLSQAGIGGVLEFFGGALLLVGLFTRPVAFLLSGEMAVAYFQFHFPQNVWPVLSGGVPSVLYCFIWLYFSSAGAGPWSLDAIRRKSDDRTPGGHTSVH